MISLYVASGVGPFIGCTRCLEPSATLNKLRSWANNLLTHVAVVTINSSEISAPVQMNEPGSWRVSDVGDRTIAAVQQTRDVCYEKLPYASVNICNNSL